MNIHLRIVINCFIVILSVAELVLTSSIYDFIVTYELFYAYPKKILLIIPSQSIINYTAALLSFILSFASILFILYRLQSVTDQSLKIVYCVIRFTCAILHAMSCSNSLQTARKVSLFIDDDEEDDFIFAARWYTLRLRLSTAFFAFTSILNFMLLFLSIDSYLHRKKPTHADHHAIIDN